MQKEKISQVVYWLCLYHDDDGDDESDDHGNQKKLRQVVDYISRNIQCQVKGEKDRREITKKFLPNYFNMILANYSVQAPGLGNHFSLQLPNCQQTPDCF